MGRSSLQGVCYGVDCDVLPGQGHPTPSHRGSDPTTGRDGSSSRRVSVRRDSRLPPFTRVVDLRKGDVHGLGRGLVEVGVREFLSYLRDPRVVKKRRLF